MRHTINLLKKKKQKQNKQNDLVEFFWYYEIPIWFSLANLGLAPSNCVYTFLLCVVTMTSS